MTDSEAFQQTVWSRIVAAAGDAGACPPSFGRIEGEQFQSAVGYVFSIRKGQTAARVAAVHLGWRMVLLTQPPGPHVVDLAAALEIANTTITYIEDKLIDDDTTNQRGDAWTHVRFGRPLTTVINSYVHFLSRRMFQAALRDWALRSGVTGERLSWCADEFENIFRDANHGQFLDIVYGAQLLRTRLGDDFTSPEDPCEYTISDHINELRTGQFIQRSAALGAVFAGLDTEGPTMRTLLIAMRLVGICVQDLNDLQDFVPAEGFPGSIGKDLLLLKKTYPVVWLIDHAASAPEARDLLNRIQDPSIDQPALVRAATSLLGREDVFDAMSDRIARRLNRASALLADAFPEDHGAADEFFGAIRRRSNSVARKIRSMT